jgi:hypothetical protein
VTTATGEFDDMQSCYRADRFPKQRHIVPGLM